MQSSVMARVLDVLRKDHDLVVVDTPPIPHVADAISLLRHVDGVLVTASVNSTRGPDASRLRDQLQALDARVLGVVANGGSALSGYALRPTRPASADGQRDGHARAAGGRVNERRTAGRAALQTLTGRASALGRPARRAGAMDARNGAPQAAPGSRSHSGCGVSRWPAEPAIARRDVARQAWPNRAVASGVAKRASRAYSGLRRLST